MKLSEYKGEKALDLLADLFEPATAIMADKEIMNAVRANLPKIKIVKTVIKNHKREVIEILAILDGEDPKEYAEKVKKVLSFLDGNYEEAETLLQEKMLRFAENEEFELAMQYREKLQMLSKLKLKRFQTWW